MTSKTSTKYEGHDAFIEKIRQIIQEVPKMNNTEKASFYLGKYQDFVIFRQLLILKREDIKERKQELEVPDFEATVEQVKHYLDVNDEYIKINRLIDMSLPDYNTLSDHFDF